jgi:hypothetical protein
MIRTQIQLEASTFEEVKAYAHRLGVSFAEVVRMSLREKMSGRQDSSAWEDSLRVAGKYRSGLKDLSEKHDDYLGDGW